MVEAYSNGTSPRKSRPSLPKKGFTLIELLMTIGCIIVLVALLFPTARNMMQSGRKAGCMNSLRQVYIGARNFAADNKNEIPWTLRDPNNASSGGWNFWIYRASEYAGVEGTSTLACPACPHSAVYGGGKGVYPGRLQNPNYAINNSLHFIAWVDGTIETTSFTRPPRFTDVQNPSSSVLFFDAGNYTIAQSTAKSPGSPWNYIPGYSKNLGKINYTAVPAVKAEAEKGRHGKIVNFIRVDGSMGAETVDKFVDTASYWNTQLLK